MSVYRVVETQRQKKKRNGKITHNEFSCYMHCKKGSKERTHIHGRDECSEMLGMSNRSTIYEHIRTHFRAIRNARNESIFVKLNIASGLPDVEEQKLRTRSNDFYLGHRKITRSCVDLSMCRCYHRFGSHRLISLAPRSQSTGHACSVLTSIDRIGRPSRFFFELIAHHLCSLAISLSEKIYCNHAPTGL